MKCTSLNNNNSIQCPITWLGKQYEPKQSTLKHRSAICYSKCIYGAMTIEIGDFVLVSNMDAAEPDSESGCDVARIVHMYEMSDVNTSMDPCRAIVQWYSRPAGLPKNILNDENYIFDVEREIIEDSRFNPDISVETIFSQCLVKFADVRATAADVLYERSSKLPTFMARYRLVKGARRKMMLESLIDHPVAVSPRKRKSLNAINRRSVCGTPTTPKLKLSRSMSVEFIDMNNIDKRDPVSGQWVVKVVDYKAMMDEVAISDIASGAGISSTTPARSGSVDRKSANVRRNLNASLRGSDLSDPEDCLNYSIVKDDEPKLLDDFKIKLRLSGRHSATATPTRRSTRKRSTYEDSPSVLVHQTSPPKTRKSTVCEPVRRKSILKTPNSKALDPGTPKRNIQLSNIVEEYTNGTRVSRYLETTPEKSAQDDEPKTPRSRGKSSKGTGSSCKGTPRSSTKMKQIRSGEIQPNIHARDVPVAGNSDDLALARERLHVSAIPKSLPCRDKEYAEIYNFLESKIYDGCGGCMYVSGVPGTGKTATTTAVIKALKALSQDEEIPKFDFIDINGMRLTEPRQAYVHIYRQLTGKTVAWEQAHSLLDKRFTTKAPRRVTTVLLVDELDILCNRRQDVVYNLLNWPTMATAQLIVITIANTMDLPERLLMGKISSRLGLTRLTFQPYNFRQLQEIVMARLIGIKAFNADAVQLVARKVAAVSGDARRALDICRRATEIADGQSHKSGTPAAVLMAHVQQALNEMIVSAKVQTIRSCSRMERLFLQSVTAEVSRTGVEECNFLAVYTQFESLAAFSGITVPNPGRALDICSRLGARRLLICENARNDIYQKLLLNVSSDDVHYALQACKVL